MKALLSSFFVGLVTGVTVFLIIKNVFESPIKTLFGETPEDEFEVQQADASEEPSLSVG